MLTAEGTGGWGWLSFGCRTGPRGPSFCHTRHGLISSELWGLCEIIYEEVLQSHYAEAKKRHWLRQSHNPHSAWPTASNIYNWLRWSSGDSLSSSTEKYPRKTSHCHRRCPCYYQLLAFHQLYVQFGGNKSLQTTYRNKNTLCDDIISCRKRLSQESHVFLLWIPCRLWTARQRETLKAQRFL